MSDPVAVNPHQVVAVASAPQPVADPVAAAEAAGAALAAAVIAPLAPEPSAGASAGGGGVGVDVGGSNPSTSHGGAPEHAPASRVSLPLEEFAEDLDLRLGRANGNIYQRREGIEGVHDGQVMVRLKKKRFIIIDYGIVPTEHDLQSSALNPHTTVPLGAGVTKCTGKVPSGPEPGAPLVSCKKIGVPVLLYDSEPEEPPSLYLRSGLCFTCQRNLNEKRRTQRKRPSDRGGSGVHAHAHAGNKDHSHASQAAFLAAQQQLAVTPGSTAALPGMQTVRIGGIGGQTNLVGAGSTGRVNATPHHRVLMAVTNGHKKIKLAHTNQPLVLAPDAIILNGPPDNHSCKSVRTGHGFAEIGADLGVEVHQSLSSAQALLHSPPPPAPPPQEPQQALHGVPPQGDATVEV
ncbi:unnamed protein product [Pseudo-nitzschia multistriata]|uniref:Uncharacterized protein n=1 Tax=Pseudo-nitzschia multistriata TaxID=183589 RepID=A0A448ZT09_9STRA|nr:unnamed protein product [Pseudo-nitzschia multistriata]